ncbi:MAG: DUF4390 domain-containing protein [Desulfofustis sp.]|nr:DUF4390 domain-containing protein [Desulfofustis sp.]MBT8346429.1 DUF4390 domain-containing protein [Desulfofustis sp.]NNK57727.1 DUF4390 domain-containing protein [Desulfofustis sp.]RZW25449.1 MAG: DUF4390 domain-containing protein [Desulfobulbaceae bacterium]
MFFKKPTICALFCIFILLITLVLTKGDGAASEQISGPHFTDIIVTTSDTHLLFFGELKNSLTPQMVEGLHSGIPLNFSFFVELERVQSNWPDKEITSIEFNHTLSYDTLKQLYSIETEELSKKIHTVKSLDEALPLINEVNGLKIVKLEELEPDQTYRLRVKADLHKKTLPFSLRRVVPFVSWWDLKTDWHSIEFMY